MIENCNCTRFPVKRLLAVSALLAFFFTPARGTNRIAGSVRNQSLGRASVGDEVILLRLDQKMAEESRTETDEQGTFAFETQNSGKPYLVRVLHQGVNYDQRVSMGETVSIDVFDAASKVKGITGSIEILRTEMNGKFLHVSDMVEIKNESSPPLTQAGNRTFEIYLPPSAKIDSVLAAGPGKIGEQISAVAVRGEPGHYAVNFPLRPGATKFAFNYDLPYDGHAKFHPRVVYPLQQFAVMIPPTMKFSSDSQAFQILATGNDNYQVEAANRVAAGEGLAFEISGAGMLPPLGAQEKSPAAAPSLATPVAAARAPVAEISRASTPKGSRRDEITQASSELLLLGTLTAVLMTMCALLVWRARKTRSISASMAMPQLAGTARPSATFLAALKKELSELESDRQRGLVSGTEYASTKQALDKTLKRAGPRVN